MPRWIGASNHLPRRTALRWGTGALAALAVPPVAQAASAARGGVTRLVCSGPAGSIPDLVARAVAEQLFAMAGQRAIVDNRPGAAGQLSVKALMTAPADGSTLLLAPGAIATVHPFLYTRLGYDPVRDLQPVSLAAEMTLGLAISAAVPAEVATLAGFIDWVRRHPTAANVGSPGTGTLPHLLAAMLFQAAGATWQHLAYSGGPPAVNDLLGGQIAALVLPEGLLRPHHAAGRIRMLATSGAVRSTYMPDVPSFVEQGHPDLVVKEWFAFFAPGGTPEPTLVTVAAALREAMARPGLGSTLAAAGITAVSSSPASLAAQIAQEQRHWQPVIRAHRISAD